MVESFSEERSRLRSEHVDANGVALHYLEWEPYLPEVVAQAGDEVPLVLLHGMGASATIWQLVAPYLCQHHLIVAFDLRGHGESASPESGYDLLTMAEDVVQGMAALGLGKVALVGHAWGARVALVLAVQHPALVSHLVLVDCPLIEPRHWPGMTRERFIRQKPSPDLHVSRDAFLATVQQEMTSFWSPEIADIFLTFVRTLPDGSIVERLKPEYLRQMRTALWDDRPLAYYGKVRCPVLLIPAAAQPQPGGHPPEKLESAAELASAKGYMASQIARLIPRCTVLWMPDTAHDIQLHRPQHLAAAIASFVKES